MSRVRITPGSLVSKPRRAQKRRRCDGHLAERHWIEVGDRFIWTALPPNHSDIGNRGWWHAAYCADCWPETTEAGA